MCRSLRGGNVTARQGVSPPTGLSFVTANVTQGLPTPACAKTAQPGAPVRTWARLVRPSGGLEYVRGLQRNAPKTAIQRFLYPDEKSTATFPRSASKLNFAV